MKTTTTEYKQLDILKGQEKDLRLDLQDNIKKQKILIIEIYKKESGFDIGDKVRLSKGRVGLISNIVVIYSTAEPIVQLYKTDGIIGKRTTRVWCSDDIQKF